MEFMAWRVGEGKDGVRISFEHAEQGYEVRGV